MHILQGIYSSVQWSDNFLFLCSFPNWNNDCRPPGLSRPLLFAPCFTKVKLYSHGQYLRLEWASRVSALISSLYTVGELITCKRWFEIKDKLYGAILNSARHRESHIATLPSLRIILFPVHRPGENIIADCMGKPFSHLLFLIYPPPPSPSHTGFFISLLYTPEICYYGGKNRIPD